MEKVISHRVDELSELQYLKCLELCLMHRSSYQALLIVTVSFRFLLNRFDM